MLAQVSVWKELGKSRPNRIKHMDWSVQHNKKIKTKGCMQIHNGNIKELI